MFRLEWEIYRDIRWVFEGEQPTWIYLVIDTFIY